MEKITLPPEILDFLGSDVGRSLMIKGRAGTGKTIFSLSLMDSFGDIDNTFYISTRVTNKALYSQFEWLREKEWRNNLIDASLDFLKSLSIEEGWQEFKGRKEKEVKKEEVARDWLKKIEGEGVGELPSEVSRANLDSLENMDLMEIEEIYSQVDSRLPEHSLVVIDSLEALTERYELSPTQLIKILQKDLVEHSGVKLILVLEEDSPSRWDYLVDGIVTHREHEEGGRRFRQIYLNKLRGVKIDRPVYLNTLEGGRFKYFEPFKTEFPTFSEEHEPIDDGRGTDYEKNDMFSSGSSQLDDLIGGGYPRDSIVLLEVGEAVPYFGQMHILGPVIENFLLQGRGMLNIPSTKKEDQMLKDWLEELIGDSMENRVNTFGLDIYKELGGGTDLSSYKKRLKEAYKKANYRVDEPILTVCDWENIEDSIGNLGDSLDKQSVTKNMLNLMRDFSGLIIGVVRPGMEISQKLKNVSDIHIKLTIQYNTLLMYGEIPNTEVYNIQLKEKEHPQAEYIPLV